MLEVTDRRRGDGAAIRSKSVRTRGQANGHASAIETPVPAGHRPPGFTRMWVAIILSAIIAIVGAVAISATLFASAGPRGPVGLTGVTGKTGPTGAQGATGARGPRGARGPAGVAGPKGATGARGMTVPVPVAGSAVALAGTDCGRGLFAGANTSCAFAQNVRAAWSHTSGETNSFRAYSPISKRWYAMSCGPNGVANVTCIGEGSSGPILVLW
jgi:Collagen triple helix repeat (20 copies)